MSGTVALVVFLLLVTVCPVRSGQAEDATALVERAVSLFKETGKEAAVKTINEKDSSLIKGDLYVFALTMDNVMLGHPYEHSLRRVNLSKTLDANGVPLFQKFKEVVEKDGSGWVEYTWAKPGEKDPSPKRSFLKKVPAEDVYVGCGYYVESAADPNAPSRK
jgi:signal transduction histidine kinase